MAQKGRPKQKKKIDRVLLKRMINKRGFTIKSLCEDLRNTVQNLYGDLYDYWSEHVPSELIDPDSIDHNINLKDIDLDNVELGKTKGDPPSQIMDETVYYSLKHEEMKPELLDAICRRLWIYPGWVTGEYDLHIKTADLSTDELQTLVKRGGYGGTDEDGTMIPGYLFSEPMLVKDKVPQAEQNLLQSILSLYNWKYIYPRSGYDDFITERNLFPEEMQLIQNKINELMELLESHAF